MKSQAADDLKSKVPSIHNWKTTDEEEIARRRLRAQTEQIRVRNLDPRYPVFSNFAVKSASGLGYTVEIRSVSQRRFSCTCVDFRINELGTCKHVEAVLLYLESRHRTAFRRAQSNGAGRIEVVPDHVAGILRVEGTGTRLVPAARKLIDAQGRITGDDLEQSIDRLRSLLGPDVRVSQEVGPWLEARSRLSERKLALHEYEQKVLSGEWPAYETLVPLYP
jgi:hypothetical protein